MKSLKKIISVSLVVICIFGMLTTGAFAIDGILDILGGGESSDDIDAVLSYGVHYEIDPYSGISVMYKPNPDITFKSPSKVEISGDFPLAIDYECIGWRSAETGKLYYPGEVIGVTGQVVLYAEWQPKTDNDSRVVRTIKTAFQTVIRSIQSALGIFKVLNTPEDQLTTRPTAAPETTKPVISLTSAIS